MLPIILFISVIFILGYAILFFYFRAGWNNTDELKIRKDYMPNTKVSIIIPARNEEKSIGILLKNILAQIYPPELTEIIVIDDHSTDNTSQVVSGFPSVKLITLADFTEGKILNAYKKKAIETGIKQSNGELIVTTDADCAMCEFWLLSIVYSYEHNHQKLIAAPVAFFNTKKWFQIFQSIDFFTMQGVTAALSYFKSGTMCNGANLAYTREAFDRVKGFDGIDDIASGDDMLLMYKIEKEFPGQTSYLKCKDAIVYTEGMQSMKSFLQQRIRWASKATKFKDKRIQFILACVFFFNLFLLFVLLSGFIDIIYVEVFFLLLVAKTAIELSLLIPVSRFFLKVQELLYVFILQIVHIPYILLSAVLSQFGTYSWKDRKVK